jgi:hypothetical protein
MFNDMALVRGFSITQNPPFHCFGDRKKFLLFNLPFPLKRREKEIYIKEDSFIFGVKSSPRAKKNT